VCPHPHCPHTSSHIFSSLKAFPGEEKEIRLLVGFLLNNYLLIFSFVAIERGSFPPIFLTIVFLFFFYISRVSPLFFFSYVIGWKNGNWEIGKLGKKSVS